MPVITDFGGPGQPWPATIAFPGAPPDLVKVLGCLLTSSIPVEIRLVKEEGLRVSLGHPAQAVLTTAQPARIAAWLVEAAMHYYPEALVISARYPEGPCLHSARE